MPKIFLSSAAITLLLSVFIFLNPTASASESSSDISVSPAELYLNSCGFSTGKSREKMSASVELSENKEKFWKGLIIPDEVMTYRRSHKRRSGTAVPDDLPPETDWSRYDSPVKSQGSCGSCSVFAAIALIENLARQQYPDLDIDLSEQAVISCAYGIGCTGGWYWDILDYISKSGAVPESCYPYMKTDGDCGLQCTYPDYAVTISDYTSELVMWGEDHSADDLRRALQDGPLIVSMRVPDDGSFEGSAYSGGIYNYEGGTISWENNSHAVLLVGYNDEEQYFKAKNSWGAQWGEGGYFRIAYDDVSDDVKFGGFACSASGVVLKRKPAILKIANRGSAALKVNRIRTESSWLDIFPYSPFYVLPDRVQSVIVSVTDWKQISVIGTETRITIESDDIRNPALEIGLTASRPPCSGEVIIGNIDCSESGLDLKDAVLGLQVLTGIGTEEICKNYPKSGTDVNGDKRIGMEEVIYILRYVSDL